jgi:ABC-type Fe3+-citrate transport system substrate-binding protein
MLVDIFEELQNLVVEENEYLKHQDDVDAEYIQNITMKKKMIQDKVEKHKKYMLDNNEQLSEEEKETINQIIEKTLEIEKNNEQLYVSKMEDIRKSLGSLHKERQVKTTYIKSGMKVTSFDTKK